MMLYTKLLRTCLILSICSTTSYAADITIDGVLHQALPRTLKSHAQNVTPNSIALLNLHLSSQAKAALNQRVLHTTQTKALIAHDILPSAKQLGMNNVPVLNQGMHGTCVTFANTGAIDAILNMGDYVSQLCQLQLGQYLANHAYTVSGWDGAWGGQILNQMNVFGVVNKIYEQQHACSSLNAYPLNNDVPTNEELSVIDYHQMSEDLNKHAINWSIVFDVEQAIQNHMNTANMLQTLKRILDAGDRMTIGIIILKYDQGLIGAMGKHNKDNDTWVLTQEIIDAFPLSDKISVAGHEMIITGYDDTAIAIDNNGTVHKGLFTLRNSWGSQVGDAGDFYISYDYVKALSIEVNRILTAEISKESSNLGLTV